jgi:hypothetical protein
MIDWTETARKILDEYCARSKTVLAGTGADADEVIEDLRHHVDEEVRAARLTVVTENDIRHILDRVGEPGATVESKPNVGQPAPVSVQPPGEEKQRPSFILLTLGVVLPLITLIFELFTGMSAGVLFDPMPSWFHVFAIALVPTANLWIWRAGRTRDSKHASLLGWLNGAASGVCLYYSVLYLPFMPFACVGIIAFGLGLIPLGPYLAMIATPWLRAVYRRQLGAATLPGAWKGAFASFGVLVLLQLPSAVTYYGLARASSEDADTKLHGVQMLRRFGDQELMLRACYGLLRREINIDLVRIIASGNQTTSADQAREIYYRVTGMPFNSVPPPSLYTRAGRWTMIEDEFTWDSALGGEAVAGRVKGLSLLSSRMDAVAEPDAALVYCEWTMEFKNVSRQRREARAQIALPPGAVVSRVTLWINSEEREAAFGGRVQVRQAYQEVAVAQRRDPVLVTTCGPDRVLMQCFPVQPDGGVMKVRIGITAPLVLESLAQGRFVWPQFIERNFGIAADLKHTRWIESPAQLNAGKNVSTPAQTGARPFTVHESLSEAELAASPRAIEVHRSPGVGSVWTPTDEPARIIRQTIQPEPPAAPARLVVVLDGSKGMQSSVRELAEALAGVPETIEIAVVVASDQEKEFSAKPQKATPAVINEIQRSLGQVHFAGGQDNLPVLEAAWDLAAAVEDGVVLWIHQPQPVLLSSESGLRQRIERTAPPTRLFELQTRNGPDRIVEKLDGLGAIKQLMSLGAPQSDIEGLLARWTGKTQGFQLVREQTAASAETTAGARASKHIERLWARDEALRLASKRRPDEAVKLAAGNQLVTPLTGAVVLETKQQYDRHDLKPADPTTVPAIPEPNTLSLVGVGILVWLLRRSKRTPDRSR